MTCLMIGSESYIAVEGLRTGDRETKDSRCVGGVQEVDSGFDLLAA